MSQLYTLAIEFFSFLLTHSLKILRVMPSNALEQIYKEAIFYTLLNKS